MSIGWEPTHQVVAGGAPAWSDADPAASPAAALDPALPVAVVQVGAHGWTKVRCENGWETWIDGADLESLAAASAVEAPAVTNSDEGLFDVGAYAPWLGPMMAPDHPGEAPRAWLITPAAPMPAPAIPHGAFEISAAAYPAGPPRQAPPPDSPSRWRVVMFAVAGFTAALGLVSFALLRPSNSSNATAQVISALMTALMVALLALSLVGFRRATPLRPLLDVLRGCFTLGAVVALEAFTHAGAPAVVVAIAVAGGAVAGAVEGSLTQVTEAPDGRRIARRAILPTIVAFGGLIVGVLGAIGSAKTAVSAGQVVGAVGAGLLLGVPAGRAVHRSPSAAVMSRTIILLVAVAFAGGLISAPVLAASAALAAEPSELDGSYTGVFAFGDDPTFQFVVNKIDLRLTGDRLTGTMQEVSKDTSSGGVLCGSLKITLSGTELSATHHEDGSLTLSGNANAELNGTSEDPTCRSFPPNPGRPQLPLALTISSDGTMSGTVGQAGLTLAVTRVGGPPGGGSGGGTPTTTEPAAASGTTPGTTPETTPDTEPTTAGTTPGTGSRSTGSVGTGTSIPPADAAKGAAGVATLLAAAGVVTAIDLGGKDFGSLGLAEVVNDPVIIAQAERWREIRRLLSIPTHHQVLTADQYIEFLQHLERTVPDATPQQIIAAMHEVRYDYDLQRKLPLSKIGLFTFGPEDAGSAPIRDLFGSAVPNRGKKLDDFFTGDVPWGVTDRSGRLMDINHVLAGIRSDMNRSSNWYQIGPLVPNPINGTFVSSIVDRDFMRWCNLSGGDMYQVISDHPKTGLAWEMYPPDQKYGNEVGYWMSEFYRDVNHKDVKFSDAMKLYFDTAAGVPHY